MDMKVVTGSVSNVSLGSDYSYAATAQHGPVAIKNQLVSMRIDNKPVLFRTRTLPSISDGDRVSAAGPEKNGTVQALAVKNLTTQSSYFAPTKTAMMLAGLLIVIGIPLVAFLGIGLLFIGFGGWVLWKAMQVRRAVAMLDSIVQ
jgi:hypothetical protein